MNSALVTIPLQIICQLTIPGDNGVGDVICGAIDKELLPTQTPPVLISNDYTPFPDIGVAYKYYPYLLTWNSARKYCIKRGSVLAEINTFEKIRHAMSVKDPIRNLHVGIHRFFDTSEWVGIKTGLHQPILPWSSESNVGKMDHKCLRMWHDGRGLTANECNSELHFICEMPLSMNMA